MPRRRRLRRPPQRPGAVMTMAVVNFIIGGLGLLCGCAASLDPIMGWTAKGGGGNNAAAMLQFLDKEAPGYLAVQAVRAVMILILSIMLIVASIGLLKLQRWSRIMCLGYAVVAFLLHLFYVIYQVAVVFQAQDKWFKKVGMPGGNNAAFSGGRYVGVGLILVLFCGHALALLIVLLLPAVAAAFAPPRRSREEEELDEDLDDDFDSDRDDDYDDDYDADNRRYRRR